MARVARFMSRTDLSPASSDYNACQNAILDEEEALRISVMNRIIIAGLVVSVAMLDAVYGQNIEVGSGWIVSTDTSPMDSVKTVTAIKDSVESPSSELVIRCRGEHAEIYVDAREVISAEYGVRVKFDRGPARTQSWQRATSYDALFAPAVVDFLRNMKSAKKFYFEYTPYGKAPRVVSFDLGTLPQSIYSACLAVEIERADVRAKKAADARASLLAQQKREHEESEKRTSALHHECTQFVDGNIEKVVRSEAPLPPQKCWELLKWMHSFGIYSFGAYEDLVNRRKLCALPSFADDPNFCRTPSNASRVNTDALADQKLIDRCSGDAIEQAALRDNCSSKWFSDSHPRACEWVKNQPGK
jgi:hypothetical protein